jgi:hypothetical protein
VKAFLDALKQLALTWLIQCGASSLFTWIKSLFEKKAKTGCSETPTKLN